MFNVGVYCACDFLFMTEYIPHSSNIYPLSSKDKIIFFDLEERRLSAWMQYEVVQAFSDVRVNCFVSQAVEKDCSLGVCVGWYGWG